MKFLHFLIIILFVQFSILYSESRIVESKQEIKISRDSFTIKTLQKIYITEKSSQDLSQFVLIENNFTKIKSIKGKVLDNDGKKIRKLKKSDYETWLGNPNYNMYSDDKYTGIDLSNFQFPYYVEFEYIIEFSSLAFLPNWFPQNFQAPVDNASISITSDDFDNLDIQIEKGDLEITFSENNGTKIWKMKNIPKLPYQRSYPPEALYKNGLLIKALNFKYGDQAGSINSWKAYGIFYNNLVEGVQDLKFDDIKTEINFEKNSTRLDTISSIYRYIQDNTHYIANTYGIHGWKPHNTSDIFKNKYGDCKDLTFLFINILKFYNIKALPTLITTRSSGFIDPEYPSNDFNHIICCIPGEDTLWIDCTSDFATVEDLPYQDEDCNVLVMDGANSGIQKIPVSNCDQNYSKFTSSFDLQETGSILITGQLYYGGNSAQHVRAVLRDESPQKQKEIITEWLGEYCPKITLKEYQLKNFDSKDKELIISFKLTGIRYANKNSNRLFFNPNFYHRLTENLEKPEKRIFNFMYKYPHSQLDIIQIKIPSNIEVEAMLEDQNVSDENMDYSIKIYQKDNIISYTRERRSKRKHICLNNYDTFFNNLRTIEKLDKTDWVFKFNNK